MSCNWASMGIEKRFPDITARRKIDALQKLRLAYFTRYNSLI